ncbi:PDC sensor domain-containing protein, partial [Campylobacter lari]|nr:PDC sensor domain-containing protein [Campylobacter lari]
MIDVNEAYKIYSISKRMAISSIVAFMEKNPNPNIEELFDVLETIRSAGGFGVTYIGFEKDGKLYQSNKIIRSPETTGFDARTRPWYKEAKTIGKLVISDPYNSVNSKDRLTISYSVPIYSNGRFIAVVGGDYS